MSIVTSSCEQPTPSQVLDFIAWMQKHSSVPMSAEELFAFCQQKARLFGLSMDEEGHLSVDPCQ
jgi:hypothetical protein